MWNMAAHPAVRLTSARPFEPEVGFAAALAYQTVVVADPMFVPGVMVALAKTSPELGATAAERMVETVLNVNLQGDWHDDRPG